MAVQIDSTTIKSIIFDFDGVLCKDLFFSSLKDSHPQIFDYIERKIFKGSGDLIDHWMRNKVSSDDITRMISEDNNIEFDLIKKIFENDVLNLKIDQKLLNFAREQSKLDRQVALVTNNMDIFSALILPRHKLDEVFKVIVNSADYSLLKTDKQGRLFDVVMEKIKTNDYSSTLLIDDSLKVKPIFEAKGGHVFTYDNFDDFISWTEKILPDYF
ncbi:hypothetical protein KKD19_05220 [Patescibacteria group bacterium]|nr:hypothetical protein [Patescibacteria group bacterium]